ncbi:MAG: transcription antitermination factor NusB [Kiritimatiellia bacterium]|jgi:transcription antitermination factor NusB
MATRREAREWALQLLFQLDFNPVADADLDSVFAAFWEQQVRLILEKEEDDAPPEPAMLARNPFAMAIAPRERAPSGKPYSGPDIVASPGLRRFSESLVRGTWANRNDIDARIESYSIDWPVYRMGAVDRNVLRLAMFEMFHAEETPPVVCINEAIDLAKFFSNSHSGSFVNGILDRAKRDVTRHDRTPVKPARPRKPTPPRSARDARPRKPARTPETWTPAP